MEAMRAAHWTTRILPDPRNDLPDGEERSPPAAGRSPPLPNPRPRRRPSPISTQESLLMDAARLHVATAIAALDPCADAMELSLTPSAAFGSGSSVVAEMRLDITPPPTSLSVHPSVRFNYNFNGEPPFFVFFSESKKALQPMNSTLLFER